MWISVRTSRHHHLALHVEALQHHALDVRLLRQQDPAVGIQRKALPRGGEFLGAAMADVVGVATAPLTFLDAENPHGEIALGALALLAHVHIPEVPALGQFNLPWFTGLGHRRDGRERQGRGTVAQSAPSAERPLARARGGGPFMPFGAFDRVSVGRGCVHNVVPVQRGLGRGGGCNIRFVIHNYDSVSVVVSQPHHHITPPYKYNVNDSSTSAYDLTSSRSLVCC